MSRAPSTCSGEMYSGVPTTVPAVAWPRSLGRRALAMPKSVRTTRPSFPSMTLSGLRSRCSTPARWAAPRPAHTSVAIAMVAAGVTRPSRSRRARSDSPSMSSMVKKQSLRSCPMSKQRATFGCVTRRARRTSRRKRSSMPGSRAISRAMTLSATVSSSVTSRARYTLPIPPTPMRPRMAKRSATSGPAEARASLLCGGSPLLRGLPDVAADSSVAEGARSVGASFCTVMRGCYAVYRGSTLLSLAPSLWAALVYSDRGRPRVVPRPSMRKGARCVSMTLLARKRCGALGACRKKLQRGNRQGRDGMFVAAHGEELPAVQVGPATAVSSGHARVVARATPGVIRFGRCVGLGSQRGRQGVRGDDRGRAGYDPWMMVALLVYAYCVSMPSSRRIERATVEDVAFRVLSGD